MQRYEEVSELQNENKLFFIFFLPNKSIFNAAKGSFLTKPTKRNDIFLFSARKKDAP